jgi:hypothetical protein
MSEWQTCSRAARRQRHDSDRRASTSAYSGGRARSRAAASGEFLLEVGVRGSAEGEPASAKLVLSGEPLVVFSMPEAWQRVAM